MQIKLCDACQRRFQGGNFEICDKCVTEINATKAVSDVKKFLREYPGSNPVFRGVSVDDMDMFELRGLLRYLWTEAE